MKFRLMPVFRSIGGADYSDSVLQKYICIYNRQNSKATIKNRTVADSRTLQYRVRLLL